jgi:predicted glycogen debranching enzyme
MEQGTNTTYVRYDVLRAAGTISLSIAVSVDWRDFHTVTVESRSMVTEPLEEGIRVVAPGGEVHVHCNGATVRPEGEWRFGRCLDVERRRGLADRTGDLRAASLQIDIRPGRAATVVATTEAPAEPGGALERRRERDRALVVGGGDEPWWVRRLMLAADQFIVGRPLAAGQGVSVIAGYPWFADWGRDTMIALPGLLLGTGRFEEAARVLRTYAGYVDGGMVPNRFPDVGEDPEYNTIDATLWFFDAIDRYVGATGDESLAAELFGVLGTIIDHHRSGTRHGIGADPADGLLRGGEPGVQLTWMDAKVDEWVVTPRIGKPVEVNALWYRALRVMSRLSRRLGRPSTDFDRAAAQVRQSFDRFWNAEAGWCFDVLDGPDGDDPALRPNQLFAVALESDLLDGVRAAGIVDVCARHLLTPLGLRTLAPFEGEYAPTFGGDRRTRDGAYHQGTVWPWLLGPFITAHLRVHRDPAAGRRLLQPLVEHLTDHGVGSLSEVADGDPPHTPGGCPFQAWSVAEALRAWSEVRDLEPESPTAPREVDDG